MSEWQNEIVTIEKVEHHPNADMLDIVTVRSDYPVIVKRDEYKVGDIAGYICTDSIVPDTQQFYFLCPKAYEKYEEDGEIKQRQMGPKYELGSVPEKYRVIKAKRIRDIYSQGMLIPVPNINMIAGDSITDIVGLKKLEEDEEDNIVVNKKSKGSNGAAPPNNWGIPYYDIDPLRKFISCIQPDEEIVLTEKIHGCFISKTPITMSDGSKKKIQDINVGDFVIGKDSNGNITNTKVINTFNNGQSNDWIKIKISRSRLSRGNSFVQIICTKNHEFYSPKNKKYIKISEFNIGDKVSYHRHDLSLPELQKQILLGKILGDGSIEKRDAGWAIRFGHSKKDIEYFNWTKRGLGEIFLSSSENTVTSGYGSEMIRGTTIWNFTIRDCFSKYIDPISGKKIINSDIINDITPIAIAFWYMDDGSLGYSDEKVQECTANFATCSFSDADHKILQKALLKFGIESKSSIYDGQRRLNVNAANAEKLFLLIAPYIPKCMERKLPTRYRGGDGWLPPIQAPVKFTLFSDQEIISIENINECHDKYDIETETHNYIANNILVHNSNASFCHDGDKFWIKSRKYYKKMDEDDPWCDIAIRYNLENIFSKYPNLVFFGELYGANKGYRYDCEIVSGRLDTKIIFFDIYDVNTKRYYDYEPFVDIINKEGLVSAPLLYRGFWQGKENMYPYAEGKTTLGGKHLREGFVLRTVKERFEPKLNSRMQVKLVGEGYALSK